MREVSHSDVDKSLVSAGQNYVVFYEAADLGLALLNHDRIIVDCAMDDVTSARRPVRSLVRAVSMLPLFVIHRGSAYESLDKAQDSEARIARLLGGDVVRQTSFVDNSASLEVEAPEEVPELESGVKPEDCDQDLLVLQTGVILHELWDEESQVLIPRPDMTLQIARSILAKDPVYNYSRSI